ncbi:MAG: hypothetical protein ACYDH9_16430 [Limisphaerales bacterium]
MKTRILTYALAAAGLLSGATFPAFAQQGAGGGRGAILSQEDRTAVQEATRTQLTQLRTDLRAAQKAAVETALSDDAKDEDIKAKLAAVSKIQNEIALVTCKAVKKTVKFTDEQTTRMKENPAIGYGTLFGGGGFGGRGGGRRGGAGGGAARQ